MREYSVAVVGATGLVGREFIKILEQRDFPVGSLRLLASERSAGKTIVYKGQEVKVERGQANAFNGVEIALFSAGADVSKELAPAAARAGAVVVDNSRQWRMDPNVPLVVPEINPDDIKTHNGIIANPNCSTIQMVVAINPIHKVNPIKRVIVDTYQSVSGTGTVAIDELSAQAEQVLKGNEVIPHVYPHQIAFNLLPEIEVFLDNGYSREEWKMVTETRKIMHVPDLLVSATTVRVPVFFGHGEAIHLELTEPMTPDQVWAALRGAPGVCIQDDTTVSLYPTPWSATGKDEVFVGRVRQDASHERGIAMWVVADNIRKGAALNAIQIAEKLVGIA